MGLLAGDLPGTVRALPLSPLVPSNGCGGKAVQPSVACAGARNPGALVDTRSPVGAAGEGWNPWGPDNDDPECGGPSCHLGQEDDEGNVEYKFKLVNTPVDRLKHLITQMNWRLNEGRGEAHYMVGFKDNGEARGIERHEMRESLRTLKLMSDAVGADLAEVLIQRAAGENSQRRVARIKVLRKKVLGEGADLEGPGALPIHRGLRVGVVGHIDAGKSTLVGVLSKGQADNGRGLARMHVFRHNHEVYNGRTSSITQQAITLRLGPDGSVLRVEQPRNRARALSNFSPYEGFGEEMGSPAPAWTPPARSPPPLLSISPMLPLPPQLTAGAPTCSPTSQHPVIVASPIDGVMPEWAPGTPGGCAAPAVPGVGLLADSLKLGPSDPPGCGKQTPPCGARPADGVGLGEGVPKVVTFIDSPGHEKYLKTTVFGMSVKALDYAMLVVGGDAGVQRMTREHLAIALALEVPLFAVVTKLDITPPEVMAATVQALDSILTSSGVDKVPVAVRSKQQAAEAAQQMQGSFPLFNGTAGPEGQAARPLVPIFCVSNVTGEGLEELKAFLGMLSTPPLLARAWEEARGRPTEIRIEAMFQVDGVGLVHAGTVRSGVVRVGDRLLLGPDQEGVFQRATVRSIHVMRTAVRSAAAGQSACLALSLEGLGDDSDTGHAGQGGFESDSDCSELNGDASLGTPEASPRLRPRKGTVLLGESSSRPVATYEFDAEIMVLHHPRVIRANYQPVIHAHNICQTATIVSMEARRVSGSPSPKCNELRSGEKAVCRFRFLYHPEYLSPGTVIVFREGRTRGFGKVLAVH